MFELTKLGNLLFLIYILSLYILRMTGRIEKKQTHAWVVSLGMVTLELDDEFRETNPLMAS
jgi:hypothetical protein